MASHHEGGHSTRGTFCLLKEPKYMHCTRYMSHSGRVTCSWLIFTCHRYGTNNSDTSTRSASRIYPKPDTSPNFHSRITNSTSIVSMANKSQPHTRQQTPRESSPLDLVHSNVCGSMPHHSLGGASYFVSFIADSTRKVWAYPARTKDRVFLIF